MKSGGNAVVVSVRTRKREMKEIYLIPVPPHKSHPPIIHLHLLTAQHTYGTEQLSKSNGRTGSLYGKISKEHTKN